MNPKSMKALSINLLWASLTLAVTLQAPMSTAQTRPQSVSSQLASIAGVWDSSEGRITFQQTGSNIQATYTQDNGAIEGSMSVNTLNGYWIEDGSAARCNTPRNGRYYWGKIRFVFDDSSFRGVWGYCNNEPKSSWSGKLVDKAPTQPISQNPTQPSPRNPISSQSTSLPASYAGVWKGTGSQPGSSWSILIALTPGPANSIVGTMAYPSLACGGELTLKSVNSQSIELFENLTYVGTCVRDGTVVLQPDSGGKLKYQWFYPDGRQAATGSLQKISSQ
jgi:hypothetical protein